MLLFQFALLGSIGVLGLFQPGQSTGVIALLALLVAFFSASQDVVLDAYRREILPDAELGLGNAIHVQAYRISSLVPGSLALPSRSADRPSTSRRLTSLPRVAPRISPRLFTARTISGSGLFQRDIGCSPTAAPHPTDDNGCALVNTSASGMNFGS